MAAKLKELADEMIAITGASSRVETLKAETAARRRAKVVLPSRSDEPRKN